jgi:uncharacterized membrane protein YphA (DoxX/SURF4 family)
MAEGASQLADRPLFANVPSSSGPLLVRVAVGWVFVVSGLVKFLFENQGPARFAKLGLPETLAYVTGAVEVTAGTLLLVGLFVRIAALPLAAVMVSAIVTTKLPMLLGPGPEPVGAPPKTGLWAFAYQSRLDVAMLLACVFLALVGGGRWSLDARLARRRARAS